MQTELDLDQVNNAPTYNNNNVLDVFITNRTDLFNVSVG